VAVRIRLRRIGKKKQPQYRLVVAEGSAPRDGRFIEVIGHYDPRADPAAVSVNEERALHWLRHGAQPSESARSLLRRVGLWEKFTGEPEPPRPLPPKAAAPESAVSEEAAEPQDEAPAQEQPAEPESE
jgi:small subunit ribosomal protein S16